MPKICICFYGLAQRSIKYTIASIKKNILQVLSNHRVDCDIFLHTYDTQISHSPRAGEINIQVDVNDYKLLNPNNFIIDSYEAIDESYNIDDFKTRYNDPWQDDYESVKNWIRELNSHYRVTELWIDNKDKYDFCVYLRPDLTYVTPFPLNYILNNLQNKKSAIFTLPWNKWGGLNDFLAVGDCDSMILWGKRLDILHEYMSRIGNNSEQLIEYIREKYQITNVDLPMLCYRTRANGNKHSETWSRVDHKEIKEKCIREGGEINID